MSSESENILKKIWQEAVQIGRPLRFMELCGTHSQTIAANGLKSLMPRNIKLIAGPGCPVCVTDQSDVDVMVGLALGGIPIAVYGDAVNVPGNIMSLEQARQKGADVNIVYSVEEAMRLKNSNPGLVFFGLGFETTAPMTAWAVKNGLVVYSAHKIFPPAMAVLMANKKIKVNGFINPGHVSAIIGTEIYKKFKIPQVIAGFEGLDILRAINLLLEQILSGKAEVSNEYTRVVRKNGNAKAQKLIEDVFEIGDAKWRGLGLIKKSGLKIRKKYQKQDAEFIYKDLIKKIKAEIKSKPSACQCGRVLQGMIEPRECPLFGKICTPDNPQGACMVSVEGSCNIEYRYGKK
ncbi:MAG: hydrogenase formation protein HypD [Parcubacteria group bacterium]|jgi:hydrogenase expression/formation protein HypD